MTVGLAVMKTCRHCGGGPVTRPRGLCRGCYHTPGVRAQYPMDAVHGRYTFYGTYAGQRPLPLPAPTAARPGSPEKLAVLERRAAAREQLWHPADPTLFPEGDDDRP